MAVKREYRCDLCGKSPKNMIDDPELIGMKWGAAGVITAVSWREVERHICAKCLSSLQSFTQVCGDGFERCNGGPKCPSDHK